MISRVTLTSIVALLSSAAALNLGLGLQATLLGVRAGIEDFATQVTGLIMSGYYLGFVLGSFLGPRLVNRVGHIRTFSVLASVASAATLCHALILEPVSWFVLRALTGLCFAGLCMVVESWLNERSTATDRGTVLSVYMTVILGATVIGQALLNTAPPSGAELFILVSVILSVALVPVALTTAPTPAFLEVRRLGLRKLYALSPVGCIGTLGAGMVTGSLWSLGAVYAHQTGLDTAGIALFMMLMIGGGFLAQLPLGKLSDRMDRRIVIVATNLAMALVAAAITLGVVEAAWWPFMSAALFGALALPLYSLSIAHANDSVDASDFIPVSGSLLLLYGSGAMVGPTVAAGVMEAIGARGLFTFSGGVAVLVALFALFRMTRRSSVTEDEKVEFVAVPRTTPVAYEMAPPAHPDHTAPHG